MGYFFLHNDSAKKFNLLASYSEYTRRNGDVPVVEMTRKLIATFFLIPERNYLARSATSQIFKMDRVAVLKFALIIIEKLNRKLKKKEKIRVIIFQFFILKRVPSIGGF